MNWKRIKSTSCFQNFISETNPVEVRRVSAANEPLDGLWLNWKVADFRSAEETERDNLIEEEKEEQFEAQEDAKRKRKNETSTEMNDDEDDGDWIQVWFRVYVHPRPNLNSTPRRIRICFPLLFFLFISFSFISFSCISFLSFLFFLFFLLLFCLVFNVEFSFLRDI